MESIHSLGSARPTCLVLLFIWPLWFSFLARVDAVQVNQTDEVGVLFDFISENYIERYFVMTWNRSDHNTCAWDGVTCTINGTVEELDFSGWGAALYLEPLTALKDLRRLNLSSNSNADLGSIGNMTQLVRVDVSGTIVEPYSLPEFFASNLNLRYLDLEQTGLGPGQLTNIGKLVNLQFLNLAGNLLKGTFSTEELGKLSSLVTLDLSRNAFSGSIPSLPNLTSLVELKLDDNKFTGFEEPWFLGTNRLQYLSVSNNKLEGSIPSNIANFGNLVVLNMSGNYLTNEIPSEIVANIAMKSGSSLDLSHNQLTGAIPPDLLLNSQPSNGSCGSLDLSHNLLTGNLPVGSQNVCYSALYNLAYNNLSGFSPSNIYNTAPRPCHTLPLSLLANSKSKYANQTINQSGELLVRALIDDFRERTRVAAASLEGKKEGWDGSLTKAQVAEWESKNPCRSRTELTAVYSRRKFAKNLPPNPLWEKVVEEYSKYHRVCLTAVGDIVDYVKQEKTYSGCQFILADTDLVGIGNKLQVVANAVFYGIITRRVILVSTTNEVYKSLCEPIVGSTWLLDAKSFLPPNHHKYMWKLQKPMFKDIDRYMRLCRKQQAGDHTTNAPLFSFPYAAGDKVYHKQPFQRFFCPTEQSFYSEITWVYFGGCLYTIPKMFAIPTFRPTLEALFPDRVILTRLFRSFLLPADPVWTRAKRIYESYLQPTDRLVGIQMRYGLEGQKSYDEVHNLVNMRVLDCVSSHQILPEVSRQGDPTNVGKASNSSSRISVLVTSLHLGIHDVVKKKYMENPTVDGALVNVVQMTHLNKQEVGVDVNTQAYTEILLLSFSDDLLLTPVSTFGGSAQAYGALSPWFIEHRQSEELPSCKRSQTVEVCNHYTGLHFDCKYDDELGKRKFSEVVPPIEDCPQIEFPYRSEDEQGLRIRTTFLS